MLKIFVYLNLCWLNLFKKLTNYFCGMGGGGGVWGGDGKVGDLLHLRKTF